MTDWVHIVGEAQRDEQGKVIEQADAQGNVKEKVVKNRAGSRAILLSKVTKETRVEVPAPKSHTGDTIEAQEPGKVLCHHCHPATPD